MRLWKALLLLFCVALAGVGMHPADAALDPDTAVVTDERLPGGLPLGGLGTGKVDLLTDGAFGNLTLNGNWDRPITELPASFFAVRVGSGRVGSSAAAPARVLALKSAYGFPAVQGVRFEGVFPGARLRYSDAGLPVDVSMRSWSPLVPGDEKASTLPAATFTFTLSNPGKQAVETAVAFSWENVLGRGGNSRAAWNDRTGAIQESRAAGGREGLLFTATQKSEGVRRNCLGEYAALAEAEGGRVETLPCWNASGDGSDFWKSFTGPELFEPKPQARAGKEGEFHPAGAVAAVVKVPAGGSAQVHFVLAWRMPAFYTGDEKDHGRAYGSVFPSAWDAALYASQNRENLLAGTEEWQSLLLKSSLPGWLRVKLLNDLAPLVSNSVYTGDGRFALLEGLTETGGALGDLHEWLVSHGALTTLYPALARRELQAYAALQDAAGGFPRSLGTLADGFTHPDSGVLDDRVDAACSYVLAQYRLFRETADLEAATAAYPSVAKALRWLKSRDLDGDGIPEGPTVWSYRRASGSFAYTATLYLAALRAGAALSEATDSRGEQEFRKSFDAARSTVMAELWNGRVLCASLDPVSGERSPNLLAAALAGEWAGDAMGLPERLDPTVGTTALRSLLEMLAPLGSTAPPNELRPDGQPDPALSGRSWTGFLESFTAALAIQRGQADAGLALVKQAHNAQVLISRSPWDASLSYDPETGAPSGPRSHVSSMGSWNLLAALEGFVPDEPGGRLQVTPGLPAAWTGLHAPLFSPRYWAWMDYGRNGSNAAFDLRLKLVKKLDERPVTLTAVTTHAPIASSLDDLTVLVTGPSGPVEGRAELSSGRLTYVFKSPYEWRQGETLELTVVPPDANNLVLQFNPNRVLSYGSLVTARELSREREVHFTLVNPTRERQVVNVRFRNPSDRNFEVYQNGARIGRFTPDTSEQRLSLVVPGSPIAFDRIDRLRRVSERLALVRKLASEGGKAQPADGRIAALGEKVETALRADETARSTPVVLEPVGARVLGQTLFRKKVKEMPEPAPSVDPEPAVAAAEAALAAAPMQLMDEISDPGIRSPVLRALSPARVVAEALDPLSPGRMARLRLTVTNDGTDAVRAVFKLDYPDGWSGPEAAPTVRVEPGERGSVVVPVSIPAGMDPRRVRLGGHAVLASARASWALPLDLRLGRAPIREWSIIGSWPAGEAGIDTKLPPDSELDPAGAYQGRRWTTAAVESSAERLDLASRYAGEPRGIAYAVTQIFSSRDQPAILELAADGGALVKLNSEVVFRRPSGGSRDAEEPVRIPVRLRQGWNALVLKLARTTDRWSFQAELTDRDGNSIPGIRVSADLSK